MDALSHVVIMKIAFHVSGNFPATFRQLFPTSPIRPHVKNRDCDRSFQDFCSWGSAGTKIVVETGHNRCIISLLATHAGKKETVAKLKS